MEIYARIPRYGGLDLRWERMDYTPAAIYQYNPLSAPPVMNPSDALNHFALQTVEFDSV
jgi:hypothetical protein